MAFNIGKTNLKPVARNIREWAQEGELTLLLDADYIPYTVGFCSTVEEYEAYQAGDEEILLQKQDHACYLLGDAMRKAGADSLWCYLTDGKTNFRATLMESYKEQRADEKPPFFYEIKDYISDVHKAIWSIRNEADDMISIESFKRMAELDEEGVERTEKMYKLWGNFIIGSKDKDLRIIQGMHVDLNDGQKYFVTEVGELQPKWKTKEVNAYEYWPLEGGVPVRNSSNPDTYQRGARKGEVKTKRVCVGKRETEYIKKLLGTGLSFFYSQLLTGDTVDNYFGLDGYGPTKAYELLRDCKTEHDLCAVVVEHYKKKRPDDWREYLTQQGQMAWMQQYVDERWRIPDGF